MNWSFNHRIKRRHRIGNEDQRQPFQRDRDRILYCSAFRRLSGVTQIVRAGEADVFHTRLAHTLKVAQVGRRLAERRISQQPEESIALGVDPEVVEAACLAHDLGHPPFGHVGEHVLNQLLSNCNDVDGFEGNAQSFRVLTKLAVRFNECDGLDLTRGTLAACIKYPWMRDENDQKKKTKWGVYSAELNDFQFARDGWPGETKTAEAELMDWADDIAYSVHDLEDFHRCQALPWHRIFGNDEKELLISNAKETWITHPADAGGRLRDAYDRLLDLFENIVPELLREPYEATRKQRQQIRLITSILIGRYIDAIKLRDASATEEKESCIIIADDEGDEVRVLKQITRDYIIGNPSLAAQQRGHRRVISDLFEDLINDIDGGMPKYLPRKFHHLTHLENTSLARVVADCISSLTEAEAIALHGRLRGYSSGSVLDPIVR